MPKNFIPESLYKKIVSNVPICCVDILLVNKNKFLLVKRKRDPFKNKWWLVGGRLFFNESFKATTKRKLKEELGIEKIKSSKFLGVGVTKYKNGKGYFNLPSHTINNTFLVKIGEDQAKNISLDMENHLEYDWFRKLPKEIDFYIKNLLKS
ncbi:MAG: NUDIX domain-containing protein [Patescibacteria group bacterium]